MEEKTEKEIFDRDSERVAFRCKVRYGKDGKIAYTAIVTDFSETGLCIKTIDMYPEGTVIKMELESSGKIYGAEGVVMWAKKAPPGMLALSKTGMGVRFTKVDPELIALYQKKK